MVLAVIYIPVLNPIFQTEPLTGAEWELVLPLLLIPSIVAETDQSGDTSHCQKQENRVKHRPPDHKKSRGLFIGDPNKSVAL